METHAFSFGPLVWQLFNLLVLIAVFAFLGWRVVRIIRKDTHPREETSEQIESTMPLNEAIRHHRTRCKMTQEFVAESLGVSRQAVSKWESGTAVPSTANLKALAKIFDVPAEVLLGGKEQVQWSR